MGLAGQLGTRLAHSLDPAPVLIVPVLMHISML